MNGNRTKNASRNILVGLVMKITQIILPFITRTAIIYILGMKYLGLSSLFTSILSVLNMAELGVGSAMVFSMYKPIAEDDHSKVCALMALYRLYYRIIGLVIAGIGIALIPFIPALIKGDVPPDINIYVLYLLNLGATVLSYWLFAYKNSILSAHQREDVVSKVKLYMALLQNVIQILLLLLTHNYYTFVMTMLGIQILTNIVTAYYANKLFPNYKPIGTMPKDEIKEINGQIRDLFTSKFGSVVFSSADSMVISAFLGLEMVGIYQNYYYVVNSLIGIIQIIFTACMAGIGNSIITETPEKNFRDFNKFTFIIAWISGFCTCCLVSMYQPFMELWAKKENMLSFLFVIYISAFFFIWEVYRAINVYKDAAGLWHTDRFRPLTTALANLSLNLLMVNFFGIYGVILSTVLSVLFVGAPWLLKNIFSTLFPHDYMRKYIIKISTYAVVTAICSCVAYVICIMIPIKTGLFMTLVIRAIICTIICNLLFFLAYFRTNEYKDALGLVKKICKR
ncbi:lipopolysaccharide biosynthesis protein [Butyrivibrio sp. INlla16]|uniref:lipopolysaccharide biosynthesis protein n=1 Tax=Butyrivibrio sp. INlla16 TaxID=1520807 RepID=UPI00087E5EDE|nr:polysaccharide biosynthesis protein [Butyrivibrio sp. INlla16]SDB66452.1 Membrane protein involved in the export of O-antigen and teichoic acid [Butyrivibrio sp. INlla16]